MGALQNDFLRGYYGAKESKEREGLRQIQTASGVLGMMDAQQRMAEAAQMAPFRQRLLAAQVQAAENPALTKDDLGDRIIYRDRQGNVVKEVPKGATPDAVLKERGATERHDRPSGSTMYTGQVTMRGQDMTDSRTREEGSLNRGVTMRGQNMTDARARESLAQGRVPAGYRANPDGSLTPIPGGPADVDKSSDTERVSAGYAGRMVESGRIMAELEKKGIGKPEITETMAGAGYGEMGKIAANVARSPERQLYRQAQEDWVRAKLRKESGAVIADEEMDREIRVYFPQIGDDAKTVKQKAESRKQAEEGMIQAAGRAMRGRRGSDSSQFKVLGVER